MKKLLSIFLSLLTSTSFAGQLHNFDDIKSAINEGKLLRIYVDYTKCSSPSKQQLIPNIIPNNAAIFTPNAMAIDSAGNITSYVLYFTLRDPRHPGKAVYQYGRYRISSDNSVALTFTVLNAADYIILEEAATLNCKIDDGAKIFINEQ